MKFFGYTFLAVLFSIMAATAAPSFAQTVNDESTPQVHAFFEYEYALQATSLSISDSHRAKIESIVEAFGKRQLSETNAAQQITAVLSSDETKSVVAIEQSFFAAMHGIFRNASNDQVSGAAIVKDDTPLDSGRFLLLLLYVNPSQNGSAAQ